VRIINASPDVATVDVFVDGTKLVGNDTFGTVTDYLQLPQGRHKVQAALLVKGIGATAISQTLTVSAGVAYTVAALGTRATGISLQVFMDNNVMATGMTKVRVYQLSPGAGSVSVRVDGHAAVKSLPYPQASDYFSLPTGLHTFLSGISGASITLTDSATLQKNMVMSIFIIGMVGGVPSLQFVNVQVKGLPDMAKTGNDLDVLPVNQQSFVPLSLWPLVILALGGVSAVLLSRLRPFARKKTLNRFHKLLWSLCALTLALALNVGGLLLAASVANPTPQPVGRLLIPAIGVDAPMEPVGVLPDSDLATPTQNPWNDVGWYSGGPRPGEKGSAVIDGHLDRPGGSPAVFWDLRNLHINDAVNIVDSHGRTIQFHIIRMQFYRPQDAPIQDIFGNKAGYFLNLMTCAGDWIPTQHQTALRLVVYAALGAPAHVQISPTGTTTSSSNAQGSQVSTTTSSSNTSTTQTTPTTAPSNMPTAQASTTTAPSNSPTPQSTPTTAPSSTPTTQPTSTPQPTPTTQPTPSPSPQPTPTTQPSPTPTPPPPVAFRLTGIDLSVSPASIGNLLCGSSVTFSYTATFHAVPNSNGGTVQFTYSWDGGLSSSSASLTFAPGQTSKTFTFSEPILLVPLTAVGLAQVVASSPNSIASPQVQPAGLCLPV
jgi:sortase (surface protein transpeptidase)